MQAVIKIILYLLGLLTAFLVGYLLNSWNNRNNVKDAVKQTIKELNTEHKKALQSLKMEHEKKMREKEQIIKNLQQIIDRLIVQLEMSRNEMKVSSLLRNLETQKQKLYNL